MTYEAGASARRWRDLRPPEHPLAMPSTAMTKRGPQTPKRRVSGAITKVGATVSAAATRVREGVKSVAKKTVAKGRSLVSKERAKPDSVGHILSGETHGLEAAAVLGVADKSSIGETVKGATGFLRVSDAVAGLGLIARGMDLDGDSPVAREVNTSVIKAQAYDWARGLGERAPTALSNFLARHGGDGNKGLPGAGSPGQMPRTSGAEETAAEPVAGEASES